ncbi:MAG: ribokinase [Chloroflexi bacterium]|nr:ribokinase [Chloroflexota bacterium]
MDAPEFLAVGHLAKDLLEQGYRLGGTVAYSAVTAHRLGRRAAMLTSCGPDVELGDLPSEIQTHVLLSEASTTFRNVYQSGQRVQFLYSRARPIAIQAVPAAWRKTPVVHLGPIAREFDEEMIEHFAANLLGLTAQGWLRRWDDRARIQPSGWEPVPELLPQIDALIVSEEDLQGEAAALRELFPLARLAVETQGERGATLYHQGRVEHHPAPQVEVVDLTGAGDVFAAAFLIRLWETGDPWQSLPFAVATASLSVTGPGLAGVPDRARVEELLAKGW